MPLHGRRQRLDSSARLRQEVVSCQRRSGLDHFFTRKTSLYRWNVPLVQQTWGMMKICGKGTLCAVEEPCWSRDAMLGKGTILTRRTSTDVLDPFPLYFANPCENEIALVITRSCGVGHMWPSYPFRPLIGKIFTFPLPPRCRVNGVSSTIAVPFPTQTSHVTNRHILQRCV